MHYGDVIEKKRWDRIRKARAVEKAATVQAKTDSAIVQNVPLENEISVVNVASYGDVPNNGIINNVPQRVMKHY